MTLTKTRGRVPVMVKQESGKITVLSDHRGSQDRPPPTMSGS
jgi:hypothetical protein